MRLLTWKRLLTQAGGHWDYHFRFEHKRTRLFRSPVTEVLEYFTLAEMKPHFSNIVKVSVYLLPDCELCGEETQDRIHGIIAGIERGLWDALEVKEKHEITS